jgi:SAM-dependent methyltransferase
MPENLLMQPSSVTSADRYPKYFGLVRDELSGVLAPNILSFGCSTGEEVFTLRSYFPNANIVGIDINHHSIRVCQRELARRGGDEKITFRCAGSLEAELSEYFDAIFALAVLRHGDLRALWPETCDAILPFSKVERAAEDIVTGLKPGGILTICHSQFLFADMRVSKQFDVVLNDPYKYRQPDPVYGADNCLLPKTDRRDVIFKKKSIIYPTKN